MAIQRIGPRVALPQPFSHLGTPEAVLWQSTGDDNHCPLTLSLDTGVARIDLGLNADSARTLRDLLDAGLRAIESRPDPAPLDDAAIARFIDRETRAGGPAPGAFE